MSTEKRENYGMEHAPRSSNRANFDMAQTPFFGMLRERLEPSTIMEECSFSAQGCCRIAHELVANNDPQQESYTLIQNPIIQDPSNFDVYAKQSLSPDVNLILLSPANDHEKTSVFSGLLKKSGVKKPTEPMLVAELENKMILPIATFLQVPNYECNFVQLGSDITYLHGTGLDDKRQASRLRAIEQLKVVLGAMGESGHTRLQYIYKQKNAQHITEAIHDNSELVSLYREASKERIAREQEELARQQKAALQAERMRTEQAERAKTREANRKLEANLKRIARYGKEYEQDVAYVTDNEDDSSSVEKVHLKYVKISPALELSNKTTTQLILVRQGERAYKIMTLTGHIAQDYKVLDFGKDEPYSDNVHNFIDGVAEYGRRNSEKWRFTSMGIALANRNSEVVLNLCKRLSAELNPVVKEIKTNTVTSYSPLVTFNSFPQKVDRDYLIKCQRILDRLKYVNTRKRSIPDIMKAKHFAGVVHMLASSLKPKANFTRNDNNLTMFVALSHVNGGRYRATPEYDNIGQINYAQAPTEVEISMNDDGIYEVSVFASVENQPQTPDNINPRMRFTVDPTGLSRNKGDDSFEEMTKEEQEAMLSGITMIIEGKFTKITPKKSK